MSDQAILSFRIGGREIDTYVHEADGLGPRVQAWMMRVPPLTAKAWARGLRVVEPDSRPTEMDQMVLMGYADIGVSDGSLEEWYCLLRGCQGDPDAILRAGVALRCDPAVRPFACWRILLDLDDPALEIWSRPPWDGTRVAPFERAGRFSWSCAPGVDLSALAEAVYLLRMGKK